LRHRFCDVRTRKPAPVEHAIALDRGAVLQIGLVCRTRHAGLGFTLLELLVVMVIIGLLASYVGPKYFGQVGKSEAKVAQAQTTALEKALEQYRLDVGSYPSSEQGLTALNGRPGNQSRWAGPYLAKAVPLDPWGRPYIYKCCPGEHAEFDLYSLGKDGAPGGSGAAADITNWTN
jgi:general secretion pathway protein G